MEWRTAVFLWIFGVAIAFVVFVPLGLGIWWLVNRMNRGRRNYWQ